jgi:hypothetical protein
VPGCVVQNELRFLQGNFGTSTWIGGGGGARWVSSCGGGRCVGKWFIVFWDTFYD